jgi:hypothetical protein
MSRLSVKATKCVGQGLTRRLVDSVTNRRALDRHDRDGALPRIAYRGLITHHAPPFCVSMISSIAQVCAFTMTAMVEAVKRKMHRSV